MIQDKTQQPTVSVVIPLYNKEPYIKRALDSVLAQTIQNIEVIVVDDGSTDGGSEVVRGYTDPRVRLIDQKNQGVSTARNKGVGTANADLIAFLDADDEWMPEFLETILRLRSKFPDAGLYGTGRCFVNPNMTLKKSVCHPELGGRILESYFYEKNHFPGNLICPSSMAVDRRKCEQIGGWATSMKRSEDEDFCARIAYISEVAYSPDVLVMIYRGTQNNSHHIMTDMQSPFIDMVHTEYKAKTLKHRDIQNVIKYADRMRVGISLRYLYSDQKKGRECANKIISPMIRIIMMSVCIFTAISPALLFCISYILKIREKGVCGE